MPHESQRRRDNQSYTLQRHGQSRLALEEEAAGYPAAFVTWEAQGVIIAGHRTRPCYALWVGEEEEVPDFEPLDEKYRESPH